MWDAKRGGHRLRQHLRGVLPLYPNLRLGNGAKILSQPQNLTVQIPARFHRAATELQPVPVGIAGLNPRVGDSPAPGAAGAELAPRQTHLELLFGYRSLNLRAWGIICCLRSCQIPGDQQVFLSEVTSKPAPSSADKNIHVGSVLVAPLGAGYPQWGLAGFPGG